MDKKNYYRVATFTLLGVLVMSIGALAGWYVVLKQKGQTISFQDAARGFGISAPTASGNGSTYNNMGGGSGGGFNIGGNDTGSYSSDSSLNTAGVVGGATENTVVNASSTQTKAGSGTAPQVVFKTPRLWHTTKTPIAGFQFATDSPAIYFAERATGHIFRADIVSGELLRKTNTLHPKVYEAKIGRDGSAILQSLNSTSGALETFVGKIESSAESGPAALVGVNLRNNILSLDSNPDAKKIFYLVGDASGFTGYTQAWTPGKSEKETVAFTSGIGSWKLFALSDGRLVIAEKPQDGAPGYAYEIGSGGALVPLVRSAPGLTVLPLSGSKTIVFGTSGNGALNLYAQSSAGTFALPIKTVADKCVWSPYKKDSSTDLVVYCAVPTDTTAKSFLQSWYMGALHTSDSWWRINLTSGKSDQILAAGTNGVQIDVVDPAIDPTGSLLAFKNNIDGTVWVLRVVK